jgi:signal transduction histidine kinase
MKPLRLRTKFTLTAALLVLFAALIISAVFVGTLTRRAIQSAESDATVAAHQILLQAINSLEDASRSDNGPVSSSPQDVRDYLQKVLEQSHGLTSELDSVLAHYPAIYEVTIADGGGTALVSSDSGLVNRALQYRPPFSELTGKNVLTQLRVIFNSSPKLSQLYQVQVPFEIRSSAGQAPYGEVRVTMEVGLLRAQITPGLESAGLLALGAVLLTTLLAGLVSRLMLSPLDAINLQLDRLSSGKSDASSNKAAAGDELVQVSTKITRLGEQLRGVREIFSTLRENLNHVMAGLEDGLILFSTDGRAVLVSPAVEKFLGAPADQLLGRRATEIFPSGNELRNVLRFNGDRLQPMDAAEARLGGTSDAPGPRNISLTVHAVPEEGSASPDAWGALLTLRDMESRERIGTELETSERLSAIARITTGVAHEVKNPLNSMRLWLENLKESLPPGHEGSAQAVRVLDSEIDRLDRVVKRFLDFAKPVEMHIEDVPLAPLLSQVVEVARHEIDRAKVRVEMRLANGVPPLRGDRELLRQAVLNLVLNAVEAMPDGGRLTISLERRGETALILVSDTGKGIPIEQRSRVFQLFFTTRKGGSGLGLASTFRIVQLHNGSINFVTEVGQGTAFRIELPLTRTQPAVSETQSSAQSVQAPHS